MKKIVFFVPAIIFTLFYGFIMIGVGLSISTMVYVWICLFLISGILLSKGIFGGGLIGMLPGIHFIFRVPKTLDKCCLLNDQLVSLLSPLFNMQLCNFLSKKIV